jgi:uncharacterized protein involved in tolerance to divalent cations
MEFRFAMDLWIGWTTVEREDDARRLAREAVEQHFAACVHVEGPVESYYHWKDGLEVSKEYRPPSSSRHHPRRPPALASRRPSYEIHEWSAVPMQSVSTEYLGGRGARARSRATLRL